VADLSPEELREMLKALEDVCAQAQELQRQIHDRMAESARANHTAKSAAPSADEHTPRKR
jgi:hypothetical protein